ncbi:Protein adenylyltransferase SoFic [Neolewinella maritima]|uniref:Protein adenylyltransferase SoFic n=2 Tax=Neolewinella maritima TaxID=1383882 RepID=A0ABM9B1D0_9BACT|nr:Protein adenylyltransferase SoFic [Neolewinella maritima]
MSSVLNNLNLGSATNQVKDLRARAIGQQIVLNRETFTRPLTETALKYWHELLLGYDTTLKVTGDYRQGTSPMRIVSGPEYKQVIHFIAPPANRVAVEMEGFIAYCNSTYPPGIHPVLSAGIAHLYFESIHPFEDGNGRIGRAILEKMLSQQLGTFIPFSISHSIEARRKAYYVALNTSQTTLDITSWLNYFCEVLLEAIDYADSLVDFTLHKQTYFNEFATQLDPHHRKAIDKLFAAGPAGFQGGMSTRKYMYINRVSQATAARALRYLTSIGALTRHGSGRSTHYLLPQST